MFKEDIRVVFLENTLKNSDKLLLYNCKDVKTLKELIEVKGFPLLEISSKPEYFWTCLHYACYYGLEDIIEYYLESLKHDPYKFEKLYLCDNDNKNPISLIYNSVLPNRNRLLNLFIKNTSIEFVSFCLKVSINKLQNFGNLSHYLNHRKINSKKFRGNIH